MYHQPVLLKTNFIAQDDNKTDFRKPDKTNMEKVIENEKKDADGTQDNHIYSCKECKSPMFGGKDREYKLESSAKKSLSFSNFTGNVELHRIPQEVRKSAREGTEKDIKMGNNDRKLVEEVLQEAEIIVCQK